MHGLTCSQLGTILQLLGSHGQLRCSVIVALWSKLLDRHNLVKVRAQTCDRRSATVSDMLSCNESLVAAVKHLLLSAYHCSQLCFCDVSQASPVHLRLQASHVFNPVGTCYHVVRTAT